MVGRVIYMSLGGRVVIKLTIWGELKRNGSTKTPSPSQLLLWNQHDLLIVVYGKTGSRAGIIHSEGGKKSTMFSTTLLLGGSEGSGERERN